MIANMISPTEAKKLIGKKDVVLLDVRDKEDYVAGHIANAIQDDACIKKESDTVVVYCYRGKMSLSVAERLTEMGFANVMTLDGGWEAWVEQFPNEIVK